ncbi:MULTISPECIES: WD40 repeat domain-containing protein [Pseudovibrio]|uniref:WD40 repeat domain-containing protein n=1 Tax=Stappiaceae TaxID=2821832 RepID=UPI002365688F|nr:MULTISPECIES: WD40 repeat domain-containing protein [Pseudovibrio]MDD7911810.1 WD40 repeat domain-containing protein [Pseudovibrio exalbescens]MDX5594741.1 WD40 repeat domain-containing protein [Pseudovibrio sp. SPO723]
MPVIAPVDLESFVVSTAFIGDVALFAAGDGTVYFQGGAETASPVHKDGLLCAALTQDGKALVTGGGDGKICRVTADGAVEQLTERPRKWIDMIATGPQDAVAFASGRTAWVRLKNGEEKEFVHQRAVGGLAFAPKGMRLATARYDGVTLWWVNAQGDPQELFWKGAHSGVCYSPDGKYIVTTMQENALHGWRLSDNQDMRMSGYPNKIKSISWSAKTKYLASSGASAAILWPFTGKNGPMGQQPLQLGARADTAVSVVCCHPKEDMLAIGYKDGMVLAVRFSDGAEVLLRRPGQGAISALSWDKAGLRLAFGTEEGAAGVITIND